MKTTGIALSVDRTEHDLSANISASADHPLTTYFIGGYTGCVKIGYSRNPEERLRQLQPWGPEPLFILATAPGGREVESIYHRRFAEFRSHGEWFFRVAEIRAEMDRLNPDLHLLLDWTDND